MDSLTSFEALVIPSDDRAPHLVPLSTSPLPVSQHLTPLTEPFRCQRTPHPEVFMDYIAEGLGPQAWGCQVIESLDWMTKKFNTPYIIFYPMLSRDGMPFPINKFLREAQGRNYQETKAWRGNIVVAKYRDLEYSGMANMSMADFPLIKNYLSMHFCSF